MGKVVGLTFGKAKGSKESAPTNKTPEAKGSKESVEPEADA